MKITPDLLKDIQEQGKVWIKSTDKDWEFLFVDLRGKDLIRQSVGIKQTESREALLTEVVLSGIKDWKNIKLRTNQNSFVKL